MSKNGTIIDNQLYPGATRKAAEARAARLDALRSWLVELRDKAILSTTKAIYQAIIDKIDEKLEGGE